jgi:hypothetical protein
MTAKERDIHYTFYFINVCLTFVCLLVGYHAQAIVASVLALLLASDIWYTDYKEEQQYVKKLAEEFRRY